MVQFGVDAATGEVRYSERQKFGLNRTAYSLGYRTSTLNVNYWPQQLTFLFPEASPNSSDVHAYDAWRFASAPVFAWNETGLGLQYDTLNVVVHHPVFEAAQFLGNYYEPYLVFGDKYARNMDAVAHEYGHGIFNAWAPPAPSVLKWWDEYFAGNEFFADMSAIFTDYYRTDSTDWYVAGLRNLQNPISTGGLDWYPEKSNLGTTNAVAYANSTIYSYAMYLLIHGGYHHRAGQTSIVGLVTIPYILVTAQPVNAVKAVLLGAIYDLRFNNAKFTAPNLKAMMVARAYNTYGPTMAQEVGDAWTAVGVGYNCSGPPPVPQYQIWPAYCRAAHNYVDGAARREVSR